MDDRQILLAAREGFLLRIAEIDRMLGNNNSEDEHNQQQVRKPPVSVRPTSLRAHIDAITESNAPSTTARPKRVFSAATKKRIAAAQRRRWAEARAAGKNSLAKDAPIVKAAKKR